jgi:hypothetical protein
MALTDIYDESEFIEIKNKKNIVLFYSEWSFKSLLYKKMIEANIDNIDIDVYTIDVGKLESIGISQKVEYLPTLHFYNNGIKQDEIVGVIPKDTKKDYLREEMLFLEFVNKNK